MHEITINGKTYSPGHTYVVAELSANHNQSLDKALQLVEAASEAGADAVKLQTYTADTITVRSDNEIFQVKAELWKGRQLHDLYDEAHMPWDWQPKLKDAADGLGIDLFSSPFDFTSVDFLETMNIPAYKIASFELVDLPLIRKVAATGKPVIMSTGMATLEEIGEALQTARDAGATQLALLKCTSAYPSPPEEMHLRTIPHLQETFGVAAGLSDHTLGTAVPVAAVALGACIIEKHFTLSRDDPGPDSVFSLEPREFKEMTEAVRVAELAVGDVSYELTKSEKANRRYRRSLFTVRNIAAGEELTTENVRSIRPGHGLAPKHLDEILGRKAKADFPAGTPLSWEMVE